LKNQAKNYGFPRFGRISTFFLAVDVERVYTIEDLFDTQRQMERGHNTMSTYTMRGDELYDTRNRRIAHMRGEDIYDNDNQVVATIRGNNLFDSNNNKMMTLRGSQIYDAGNKRVASVSDAQKSINGIFAGMLAVALWYCFIRE